MAVDKNTVAKEAQKFAAKGQFDKAIAEWKKLVKESPNDANTWNTIGDLCLKKNSKDEAVDAYKKAADILGADGFTSKAIALYKKVLNINPKKVEVHLALGDMNAEKGLVGNALESYKLAADHFIANNDKRKALGIYQKMADLNPANVAFRLKLADMYVKEKLTAEAAKAYLDASDVHVEKGAFQEARQLFEKVLALDPQNKNVYHKAGIVYAKEGKYVEACKALKPVFEKDPANQEVTDLYIEALSKAGRGADAEEVYRRQLEADPSRLDLREKLYELLLANHLDDKAAAEASAIAAAREENRDLDGVEAILKGFVDARPQSLAGRRALSRHYDKYGRTGDAARELLAAADLLLAAGDRDAAREEVHRALQLAPDFDEAKRKLDSLTEAPLAPPEPESPFAPAETFAPEPAVPAFTEDPALTEALTEADVLVKYGLAAKAAEQLEGLSARFPDSTRLFERLRDLYKDLGKYTEAAAHAATLADLLAQNGATAQSEEVLRDALSFAPDSADVLTRLGMAVPEAAEEIETVEEPEAVEALEELTAPALDFEAPPLDELQASPAQLEEFPAADEPFAFAPEAPVAEPEQAPLAEAVEYSPPPAEPEQFTETPAGAASEEPLAAEQDISEIWAEAEFYYQQGLFDEARQRYEKVLELRPGDPRAMERIVEITRDKEEYQEFSRLSEAVEGLESLVTPPGAAAAEGGETVTESDVDAMRSLMQELQDLKRRQQAAFAPQETPREEPAVFASASPPAPAQESPSPPPAPAEEEFFDLAADLATAARQPAAAAAPAEQEATDGDFFDLAAELRDELGSVSIPAQRSEQDNEQSLDDIFEEFKKGVETTDKREDLDSHYNLGVAYKEMGLLDDAIAEFILTPEGEPKFIQSRYMLGLCYLEMGDYQKAIAEIQNALGYSYSFGEASEERLGLHYDLGLAYQGVGNADGALQEFQKVSALDPEYREVAVKLKELREGDFISLDSIREDIEKEISFKFLEEGARIDREEQTKRSEKVKS